MAAVRNTDLNSMDALFAQMDAQVRTGPTTQYRPPSHEPRGSVSPTRVTIREDETYTSAVAYQAMGVEETPEAECCLDSNNRVCAKVLFVIATVVLFGVATWLTGGLAVAAVVGGYSGGMQALWIGFTIAFGLSTIGASVDLPRTFKMGTDTGHNCDDTKKYFFTSLLYLFDLMGRAIDWAQQVSWWNVMDGTPAPASQGCPSCSESPSCHEVTKCIGDCCSASNCQGCDANCCPSF